MNFAIINFGCKVNQYQGELLRETLISAGFESSEPENADIVFINGCLVTDTAEKEAVRVARKWSGKAKVVATGCAGVSKSFEGFEQVDPTDLSKLSQILQSNIKPKDSIQVFSGHTRAMLLVQLGCDNFCSYCIVPSLRGKPVSRKIAEIVTEAENLAKSGHCEIVLCGTELGHFENLTGLLEKLSKIEEIKRIRLSSINPRHLTTELVREILSIPKVSPHLHLPLQSASDKVLAQMKRGYDSKHFLELVQAARSVDPYCGITTDIIIGFPGESEEDFEQTCFVMREARFDRCHIFPFSPRKGTPASLKEPLPADIVKARAKSARLTASHLANNVR
ncbi:MAG: MiaB/RimO family radical SAM methylthiotransferase, partial [Caldiserica bacterium]|nr:MiaB/RimO family radical SAM methylthiotransferase [Caldisericota bacterium]